MLPWLSIAASFRARSCWGNSYSVTTTLVDWPRGRGKTRRGASCESGPRTRESHLTSKVYSGSGSDIARLRTAIAVPLKCIMRSTIRLQPCSSNRFLKICCQEWHPEQYFCNVAFSSPVPGTFHKTSALLSWDSSSGEGGRLSEFETRSSTMSSSFGAPLIETESRRYGLNGTGVGMRNV